MNRTDEMCQVWRTMLIRVPDDILLRFPDIKVSDVLLIQRASDIPERIAPAAPAAPARRKPGPKPGLRKAKAAAVNPVTGKRKKSAVVPTPAGADGKVLAAIGASPMSVNEIVTATGLDAIVVPRVLLSLRQAGKIAAQGKSKGMKYTLVQTYDHAPPSNGAASAHDLEMGADSLDGE